MNALFDAVDSADRAPARQMHEVFDLLSAQFDTVLQKWRAVEDRLLPELDKAMSHAGLPAIGNLERA